MNPWHHHAAFSFLDPALYIVIVSIFVNFKYIGEKHF